MRKRLFAAAGIFLLLAGGCKSGNPQPVGPLSGAYSSKTVQEEKVVLTERQKDILEQTGLPTEYNELTFSQQSSITAIEEMLCYLEERYGSAFEYAEYVPAGNLEYEHLTAYPLGNYKDGFVTVYRKMNGGSYEYQDDYSSVLAKPKYREALLGYFDSVLAGTRYDLYFEITSADDDLDHKNVLSGASASSCLLIDDSGAINEQRLSEIINEYAVWIVEQSGGKRSSSLTAFLVTADFMDKTTAVNYESRIASGDYCAKLTCSVSSSGDVNIW